MNTQEMIERRVEAIKQQFYSNRIEGAVDEKEIYAMLERAKEPISDEEFVEKELVRFYARYGLKYVK